ncbi:unnamed protein product [Moneuplotes crassus]|uniref:Tubulin/FtsZ 2-layer sandwich domain-containing protein n=1 Tax=Euplotes crassus TaxID=5936 RepID=A0AAD1UAV6_EUPCR|nr:unnamed protein product [Moneuplotes crassus]
MNLLIEYADGVSAYDNEAIYEICLNFLKLKSPHYCDINHLISSSMCEVTASFRFDGKLNTHLRKQIFDPRNMMCAVDPSCGKYFTVFTMLRSQNSLRDVHYELERMKSKIPPNFNQCSIKSECLNIPAKNVKLSGAVITNSTSNQEIFCRIGAQFDMMFKRKAFLYSGIFGKSAFGMDGMDELEFVEARSNLADLISDYQQYQETETNHEEDYSDSESLNKEEMQET